MNALLLLLILLQDDHKKISLGNDVTMEFVRIKPGTFLMGSPADERDRDSDEKRHKVTIAREFWMQTTQVTQAQWKALMGDNPSRFKGDTLPVERVSWTDCQEFLRKLNGRLKELRADLPAEAEWEYACRAGSTWRWSFGESERELWDAAWYRENSDGKTHPVAQKKPNAWGLYDMHGNVYEWCKDGYAPYRDDASDAQGAEERVLRGGAWSVPAQYTRSANRTSDAPDKASDDVGFRVTLR